MAAAELGADNQALQTDPRLPLPRATLQPVPTLPRIRLHKARRQPAAEIVALVRDDLVKILVSDVVAPTVEAHNRADLPGTVVVLVVEAPKVAAHREIAGVLRVAARQRAERNPVGQAVIVEARPPVVLLVAVETPDSDVRAKTGD